ncbi:hypothetical protein BRADI_2g19913v3 [Brachypodium distachyon]|uniref:Uncharacterized protein n=1 Tax=Brachypodium distachyon TaxID=15368 RepID=A0A0Q3G219_BRADI|nr:hypothetical protein BRADI_2g19913v3 [Brachypodium distachyon]
MCVMGGKGGLVQLDPVVGEERAQVAGEEQATMRWRRMRGRLGPAQLRPPHLRGRGCNREGSHLRRTPPAAVDHRAPPVVALLASRPSASRGR